MCGGVVLKTHGGWHRCNAMYLDLLKRKFIQWYNMICRLFWGGDLSSMDVTSMKDIIYINI